MLASNQVRCKGLITEKDTDIAQKNLKGRESQGPRKKARDIFYIQKRQRTALMKSLQQFLDVQANYKYKYTQS